VLFAILQDLINRWIDDDEYKKISQYYKDTHYILMLPNGKHLKFKLGYGYNVFHVMGLVISEAIQLASAGVLTGRKTAKLTTRLLSSIADAFNPMGSSGSLAQFIAPTILDPVVQISENKNFFGAPIKPEQPAYTPKKPESQLHFKSVNPASKVLTDWLHDLSGGGELEKGVVEISPETVDHLIDFADGGAGKGVTGAFKTTYSLATGKVPAIKDIPFVRKFYGESSEWISVRTVYDMVGESARTKFSQKEREEFYSALKSAQDSGSMSSTAAKRQRTIFNNAQTKLGVSGIPKKSLAKPYKRPKTLTRKPIKR